MPKVKHRHSRTRGKKRRTHYKAEPVTLSKCSQCGKPKPPHKICCYCGYYKKRQIIRIETALDRKARKDKKKKKS